LTLAQELVQAQDWQAQELVQALALVKGLVEAQELVTGTGEGTGEGEDTGTGTGIAGADGMLSPTRTTDLLFADLFKSNVQIGSNQEIAPYVRLQQPSINNPYSQGMLTNQDTTKRFYS
jgi:hypothetical protein